MSASTGRWLTVVVWWLMALLASLSGAAAVTGVGALWMGVDVSTFLEGPGFLAVLLYNGVHWTGFGLAGTTFVAGHRFSPTAVQPATVGAVVVAGIGFSLGASGLISLLGLSDVGATGLFQARLQAASPPVWWALAVGLTVVPAIGEEVFFRGFVLQALAGVDRQGAVWTAAILFAVTHVDPVQSPYTLLLGLWMGWLVVRTGALWLVIIAHGANNAVATVWMTAALPEPPLSPMTTAIGGALIAAGAVWCVVRWTASSALERR